MPIKKIFSNSDLKKLFAAFNALPIAKKVVFPAKLKSALMVYASNPRDVDTQMRVYQEFYKASSWHRHFDCLKDFAAASLTRAWQQILHLSNNQATSDHFFHLEVNERTLNFCVESLIKLCKQIPDGEAQWAQYFNLVIPQDYFGHVSEYLLALYNAGLSTAENRRLVEKFDSFELPELTKALKTFLNQDAFGSHAQHYLDMFFTMKTWQQRMGYLRWLNSLSDEGLITKDLLPLYCEALATYLIKNGDLIPCPLMEALRLLNKENLINEENAKDLLKILAHHEMPKAFAETYILLKQKNLLFDDQAIKYLTNVTGWISIYEVDTFIDLAEKGIYTHKTFQFYFPLLMQDHYLAQILLKLHNVQLLSEDNAEYFAKTLSDCKENIWKFYDALTILEKHALFNLKNYQTISTNKNVAKEVAEVLICIHESSDLQDEKHQVYLQEILQSQQPLILFHAYNSLLKAQLLNPSNWQKIRNHPKLSYVDSVIESFLETGLLTENSKQSNFELYILNYPVELDTIYSAIGKHLTQEALESICRLPATSVEICQRGTALLLGYKEDSQERDTYDLSSKSYHEHADFCWKSKSDFLLAFARLPLTVKTLLIDGWFIYHCSKRVYGIDFFEYIPKNMTTLKLSLNDLLDYGKSIMPV